MDQTNIGSILLPSRMFRLGRAAADSSLAILMDQLARHVGGRSKDRRLFASDFGAAERLKNVAPGASPGLVLALNSAPEGRKTQIFRPFRGSASPRQGDPGLTPGATFLSRSAARTASAAITSNH
ncbi:MAG: hypothetical protein DMG13_23565 [Acidobacteria bacterium]|nr:MAG: hypothetical protein DMG13_23565 [Acidobacteriota bacterium]